MPPKTPRRAQSSVNKFSIKFLNAFFRLALLFFFLSQSVSLVAQTKPTLAVLNFKSDGSLKAGQLISMSEQVASGLNRQGKYTVIDRSGSFTIQGISSTLTSISLSVNATGYEALTQSLTLTCQNLIATVLLKRITASTGTGTVSSCVVGTSAIGNCTL